jgi:hypothetical protein
MAVVSAATVAEMGTAAVCPACDLAFTVEPGNGSPQSTSAILAELPLR